MCAQLAVDCERVEEGGRRRRRDVGKGGEDGEYSSGGRGNQGNLHLALLYQITR